MDIVAKTGTCTQILVSTAKTRGKFFSKTLYKEFKILVVKRVWAKKIDLLNGLVISQKGNSKK